MKKFIFFSLIMLAVTAFAIGQSAPNRTDANGKKQGAWEEKNANALSKGKYVNDLKDGCWANYSSDGKLIRVENFVKGVRDGICIDIDQRGYLSGEATYANGLLEGTEKKYFYGLSPASIIEYSAGKINGMKKVYYENSNGKLMEESEYKNDMKDGVSKFYTNTGDLIASYIYSKNQLNGVQKTFYAGNKLQSEQEYANNQENGFYREYFENGQLKTDGSYLKGKPQGIYKEYNEQGKLLLDGTYVNGLKEGKWTDYDGNGKVLKVQKFAKDKPVQ